MRFREPGELYSCLAQTIKGATILRVPDTYEAKIAKKKLHILDILARNSASTPSFADFLLFWPQKYQVS